MIYYTRLYYNIPYHTNGGLLRIRKVRGKTGFQSAKSEVQKQHLLLDSRETARTKGACRARTQLWA